MTALSDAFEAERKRVLAVVQSLPPGDSRRAVARARLSTAEEHLRNAERKIGEAMAEATMSPEAGMRTRWDR